MDNLSLLKQQEYQVPEFTRDMLETHKILVPQMAPIHFGILKDLLIQEGYDVEIMENCGPDVIHEGLQYVHNDACYPALVVIGQFIDALKSGKYDTDRVALLITQTGGGCRASNYIHLLRKALVRAGFENVPVLSLNAMNLEKDASLPVTLPLLRKALASIYYGDALMALSNQVKPYEKNSGQTMTLVSTWQKRVAVEFEKNKGMSKRDMTRLIDAMTDDFAAIETEERATHKVGIVGEIYVKFSPLGNNHLEDFLASQNCEVCIPALMGFLQYCLINTAEGVKLYGGSKLVKLALEIALEYTVNREHILIDAIKRHPGKLRQPGTFKQTRELAKEFIGIGVKMGEGWLLTGEMAELIENGFHNVICTQPFGCLPNHIVGRGMVAKLNDKYPDANIVSIDYDPSATKVNQENRIKLMLSSSEMTS